MAGWSSSSSSSNSNSNTLVVVRRFEGRRESGRWDFQVLGEGESSVNCRKTPSLGSRPGHIFLKPCMRGWSGPMGGMFLVLRRLSILRGKCKGNGVGLVLFAWFGLVIWGEWRKMLECFECIGQDAYVGIDFQYYYLDWFIICWYNW